MLRLGRKHKHGAVLLHHLYLLLHHLLIQLHTSTESQTDSAKSHHAGIVLEALQQLHQVVINSGQV